MKWAVTERLLRSFRMTMAALSVLTYTAFAPIGYSVFAALSLLPARDPLRRARLLQGIMRRAFALMHHWLRWVRVLHFRPGQLRGRIGEGPCVVIANHPDLTDVTAVMSAVPMLCTPVKPQLYRKWWLRPLVEGAGFFSGALDNVLGSQVVVQSAERRLAEGFRVLVFPEGTRSPRAGLGPFGRVAFEIACRAGVPVVPLLVRADPVWLAKGDSVFAPPARLPRKHFEVLPTLHPADFGGDSRKMRDHAQAMYSRLLRAELPSAPPALTAPPSVGMTGPLPHGG